jgi:D-alanyl-D-alanine carboxypeptidase/D-alanyl-D-alanine-endopeptidase (penicillin-binding protein 4)
LRLGYRARGLTAIAVLLASSPVAVLAGGCGAGAHPPAPRRLASVASAPEGPPRQTTPRAPATAPAPPPTPALNALTTALSRQLAAAGPGTGALVYDLTKNQQLFALRADVGRPPASVEKLYTTAAVLKLLGPDARFQTALLGNGHLGPGGVWHGDIYLRGGGDPTFGDGGFNRDWEQGYGPTAEELVAQLSARGVRKVTGMVIGDASLFDAKRGVPSSGYAPDVGDLGGQLAALTYDHGATTRRLSPGAFAARELALTMQGAHIKARAAKFTATAPASAEPLASLSSPPTAVLLKLTDVPSDDFFAEMLTKQLGVRFGAGGSTSAGAAVISNAIAGLGLHPRIVDGSGLSRSDQSSPQQVVDLLREVWGTPTGQILRASLPVVGMSGTVQGIAAHTAAQGRCVAKTGTLNYVTNLAGYCGSRGGDTLAFALFLDGPDNSQAITLIGKMVAAIARY